MGPLALPENKKENNNENSRARIFTIFIFE